MTTRCARMASVSISDSSEEAITGDAAHAPRRTSVSATEEAIATRREGELPEVGEGNERDPSSAAARRGVEREANAREDRRGALAGNDEADAALIIDPSMPARVAQCDERPQPAEAFNDNISASR
mmetsp:Transcript_9337/g.38174  ORF Transcript_9337/g.38174 Transcript_9337/m.38174 type:complete len:125 (-) Transcript_9337:1353-1727(-)